MAATLQLNCWVLGDDANKVFYVEIANDRPVSALKKAIKYENSESFQGIDARSLILWKVSIPDDDDRDARLKRFRPKRDAQNGVYCLSKPMKRLHEVFGDPTDDHLHVIVVPPVAGERWSFFLCSSSSSFDQ